jgi:hypothetical protein
MDKARRKEIRAMLTVCCGYCAHLADKDCDGGTCRGSSPHAGEHRALDAGPCEGYDCNGQYDDMLFEAATDCLPAALDALDEADRRIAELEAEINRRDSMDAADIEVVAQTTGDLGAEVARLRLAVGVRDKAAIGGGPADKLGNFSCGYCGVIGINPCSNQCPTITHPLDKEGCR